MKSSLLLLLLLTLTLTSFSSAESKPPNIVYLMSDDQRWDTLGCYGRPEFKTENIDQLASEGVVFDRAYYAVAICRPSPATVMSGRYFASHNVGFTYPHSDLMSKEEVSDTYHARLKAAGYRSGFVGKFGYPIVGKTETLKPHFDYMDARPTHSNIGTARWAEELEGLNQIHRRGRSPKERTLIKGDSMIHFLDTQPKGKPFILSVSFDAVKNDRDSDMYGPDTEVFEKQDFSVPENWYEGANESLPKVVQEHARGYNYHLSRSSTPEQYQRNTRRFATQGLTVDNQVGRLISKLKEMGELENTVIIYTSDNGRYHGSQGLYDKALLHEESVKAPLIIWDGRVASKEKAHRVSALTSSVDLAPTILSLAGVDIPERMQGVSLLGLMEQTADLSQWRDAVFMENLFIQEMWMTGRKLKSDDARAKLNQELIADNRSYRSRGIRTAHYKYFIYYEHTPVIEELYDLQSDPLESTNLASDPAHADTLAELRTKTEELYARFK